MVCQKCIFVVKNELEALGIPVLNVTLGEATVEQLQEGDCWFTMS